MKQQVIQAYDDIERYVGNLKVEATEERNLTVDGRAVVLDLTAEHAKTFDEAMAPYLAAGQPVKTPPVKRQGGLSRGRQYNADMRAWADSQGRSSEYKTPSGSFYYQRQLRDDYEAYLASQGE